MKFKTWIEAVDFDDPTEFSIVNDMKLIASYSKEDFIAKRPQGYVYDPTTEIARFAHDKRIHLSDHFFELPYKDRYYIVAHEIGHGLVERIGWNKIWGIVDSGILGSYDGSKFNSFLGPRKNPDEVLADLFAMYFTKQSELKSKYPQQYALVKELLK